MERVLMFWCREEKTTIRKDVLRIFKELDRAGTAEERNRNRPGKSKKRISLGLMRFAKAVEED